jgi:hypothetical protein
MKTTVAVFMRIVSSVPAAQQAPAIAELLAARDEKAAAPPLTGVNRTRNWTPRFSCAVARDR